ncbi:MAG: hypothetical protein ACPG61_07290 [Paracoccaceae bacterium]
MPRSFPLSLSEFWDQLPVINSTFYLPSDVRQNWTNGGDPVQVDPTPRLWQGSVQCARMLHDEAGEVAAALELIMRSGGSFLARPMQRVGPANDPDGSVTHTASLGNTVTDGGRTIKITGLAGGFTLRRGDFMSISYGTSPIRRGFHRFVTTETSTGPGVIDAIEVNPPLRTGYDTGDAITINNPFLKAVIDPETFNPQNLRASIADGFSFGWRQTLR